ncbi:MAG: PAS domain S-box protein [Candidatus Krumholzibacteriota bacterium]|nr:PAS domain S-box protein [Candidatus Krumholzibacteriota bacterium]
MKRVHGSILIALVYTLLLAVSPAVPMWVTIPAGGIVTAFYVAQRLRNRQRRLVHIQRQLSNLRSEGLYLEGQVQGTEEDVFYRMILTLLTDLERSLFKLVEKNIQLLSLKEIGRSIISSLDEKKLIDSVFDYLVHGVGYKEIAFVILRKKKARFQAIVSIERSTRIIRRVLGFGFEDLGGAVYNAFISGKPFLIKDIRMHPLMEADGEAIFPGSTMSSYIIVPLMKSAEGKRCWETEDCLLSRGEGGPEVKEARHLRARECLSCPGMPLLGALVVTDGYRATPLTNIDQVTMETVGSLVSSTIENWQLYQELRKEELFRDKILEEMIHGIFVVDLEGRITLANRKAREMSRMPDDGPDRVRIEDLLVTDSIEKEIDRENLYRMLAGGTPIIMQEAYLKGRDGIHLPIRMNISPLSGEDGGMQGAIILFEDISQIKRLEEEIRHLDRLAVLGRFTSAVAHEIRNPLTGIAAGIQYLDRDERLDAGQKENLSFIMNEVDRLNRIITDLFKVAKPHQLLYQWVKLGDLVSRARKSAIEVAGDKEIDFRIDIDDTLPEIEVDSDRIVQVLINLFKNAAEAVDGAGIVRVSAEVYRGGDTDVVVEKEREMIRVTIADDGRGIKADDREKIFEPFFSRRRGGTGLGLFVTHSIVQHHQGRITVESEEGEGTTMRLYLPISQPPKGETVEAGHPAG